MKTIIALAVMSACIPSFVIAQTERDLESHVHGSASLNVAIVDSSLFIELNTPWNNLVGFEHVPRTDEQHNLVDSAVKQLNDPAQLFSFDGGNCALSDAQIESAMLETSHEDEHDTHEETHSDSHDDEHEDEHQDAHDEDHNDSHDDEDAHDEDHNDSHDDEEAHDEHKEDTHTAALVIYSFECENIDEMNNIDLLLFSVWPGFEELDVQLIGEGGQALVELDSQNSILNISQVK